MKLGRRSVMAEVEDFFGQPFWDVVKGFAADGESIVATAAILGYASHSSFDRLLTRHGKKHWFRPGVETNGFQSAQASRKGVTTPAMRAAALNAGRHSPTYVWLELDGIMDTVAGHARRVGISRCTVYNRHARGIDWVTALTMPVKSPRPHSRPKNHPWQRSMDYRRKKDD